MRSRPSSDSPGRLVLLDKTRPSTAVVRHAATCKRPGPAIEPSLQSTLSTARRCEPASGTLTSLSVDSDLRRSRLETRAPFGGAVTWVISPSPWVCTCRLSARASLHPPSSPCPRRTERRGSACRASCPLHTTAELETCPPASVLPGRGHSRSNSLRLVRWGGKRSLRCLPAGYCQTSPAPRLAGPRWNGRSACLQFLPRYPAHIQRGPRPPGCCPGTPGRSGRRAAAQQLVGLHAQLEPPGYGDSGPPSTRFAGPSPLLPLVRLENGTPPENDHTYLCGKPHGICSDPSRHSQLLRILCQRPT